MYEILKSARCFYFDPNLYVRWALDNGVPVQEHLAQAVTDKELRRRLQGKASLTDWAIAGKSYYLGIAKTLRERCLAWLWRWAAIQEDRTYKLYFQVAPSKPASFVVEKLPKRPPTLKGLLRLCYRDKKIREFLGDLPIATVQHRFDEKLLYRDDEVYEGLQDLASIVAWEAGEAFLAACYPRPVDVPAVPDELVRQIMAGMQREMDREGKNKPKGAAQYNELPWERQVALAERRRWWIWKAYGISPENWANNTWSLWKVSDTLIWPPKGYFNDWDLVHPNDSL